MKHKMKRNIQFTQFEQPKEDGARYYEVGGESLPSVTTILALLDKKVLLPWSAKCVAEHTAARLDYDSLYSKHDIVQHLTECRSAWVWESDKATEIGTNVHGMIELVAKKDFTSEKAPECTEEANCMIAFYEWMKEHAVSFLETESLVSNVGYAGRTDIVAVIDGVKTLLDVKTSKAIYPEYRMQVAAYVYAYNRDRADDDQVKAGAILRLDKLSGEFEYKQVRAIEKEYAKFLSLAAFYALYKDTHVNRALALFDMASSIITGLTIKPRKERQTGDKNPIKRSGGSTRSKCVADLIESATSASTDPCDPFL